MTTRHGSAENPPQGPGTRVPGGVVGQRPTMKIDSISMDSAECGVFAPEVAVLPLLERHAVQVLLAAGHGPAEVAELRKVAARTVHRIAKESAVVHVDDAAERRSRRVGRPSQLEAFRTLVADTLAAEPLLPSVGVLHRVRAAGYRGGKSALYAMVALARPKPPGVMMRFEAVPGEFSQHDFGQVLVRYLGGKVERVRFFASRLKYSRYAQVSLVPDETTETLVRAWAEHLAAFGGVPLLCVFDRPRTIADRWRKDGTVTHWNAAFAQAALDLGVGVGAGFCAAEGVELCWPRRCGGAHSVRRTDRISSDAAARWPPERRWRRLGPWHLRDHTAIAGPHPR